MSKTGLVAPITPHTKGPTLMPVIHTSIFIRFTFELSGNHYLGKACSLDLLIVQSPLITRSKYSGLVNLLRKICLGIQLTGTALIANYKMLKKHHNKPQIDKEKQTKQNDMS